MQSDWNQNDYERKQKAFLALTPEQKAKLTWSDSRRFLPPSVLSASYFISTARQSGVTPAEALENLFGPPSPKLRDDKGTGDTMVVELTTNATYDDLIGLMLRMKEVRINQRYKDIVCSIRGFDLDPRELYEIPEAIELCTRLVDLGFVSFLTFSSTLDPKKDPVVKSGLGIVELFLISERRMKPEIVMSQTDMDEIMLKLRAANARADALIGRN